MSEPYEQPPLSNDPINAIWEFAHVIDAITTASAIIAVGSTDAPRKYAQALREYAERLLEERLKNPAIAAEEGALQRVRHMLEQRLTVIEEAAS